MNRFNAKLTKPGFCFGVLNIFFWGRDELGYTVAIAVLIGKSSWDMGG